MIIDLDPITTKYISLPRELSQLCCSSFIAGVLHAVLEALGFDSKVTAHTQPAEGYPSRTVFLIKFDSSVMSRENSIGNLSKA